MTVDLIERARRTRPGGGRRGVTLTVLLLAAVLALAGCSKSSTSTTSGGSGTVPAPTGSVSGGTAECPTSNTKSFAKTKFVLHTGLAFGTFHRYIYKPLKNGGFQKGANGRIRTFVKAGATALFMKREIRLAAEDVKANPTLCRTIAAPLSRLGESISSAVTKLEGGDPSGVEDANTRIGDLTSKSAAGGAPITERTDESAG